jgi:peptide deformylase
MPAKNSLPVLLPADLYDLTAEDRARFAEEQKRGMLPLDDPLLNKIAQAVAPNKIASARIQQIITRLLQVATGQQQTHKTDKRRRTLVGLAAPQIGEALRIVVVDTKITPARKNPGKLECFINPEIVWRSRETEEGREGCFSTGPVWGLVQRPVAVKIRAFTPKGQPTEQIFEGFTARIVQHEIDHLDGVRFPDRIKSDKKRHWVHAVEIPTYVTQIKTWQRCCTKARWEKLKHRPPA